MVTPEEAIRRIEQFTDELLRLTPAVLETMLVTGKSLIEDRIQREGLLGEEYSNREVPTFYFKGKELNQAGRSYIKLEKLGTWGDFREAQGLQSDYVDLTYTGAMWAGIVVVQTSQAGYVFIGEMGGRTPDIQEVLNANISRYGDFLVLSPEEEQDVAEIHLDMARQLAERIFNY